MIGSADRELRIAVFEWLTDQRDREGDVLPWAILKGGAEVLGRHIHLLGPQGIFKPSSFELPLSITTSPKSLYSDRFVSDSVLEYSYRGSDPQHPDNVALRRSMRERIPLVYFHGIEPGAYLATYPVFIVGDDPDQLRFRVQADDLWAVVSSDSSTTMASEDDAGPRRAYITATVRRRLHQVAFRERVIRAYRDRCALCRLNHPELLDAAHITADSDPNGLPVVSNGLSLCKLHHAAFDRLFFAVTTDYRIEVRPSILTEADGPMLVVGLQQIHGQRIELPTKPGLRPDRDRLAARYDAFQSSL